MYIQSLTLNTRKSGKTLRRDLLPSVTPLGPREARSLSTQGVSLLEPRASSLRSMPPVYPWCRPVTAWGAGRVYPGVYTGRDVHRVVYTLGVLWWVYTPPAPYHPGYTPLLLPYHPGYTSVGVPPWVCYTSLFSRFDTFRTTFCSLLHVNQA